MNKFVLAALFVINSQSAMAADIHYRSPDTTVIKVEELYSINNSGGVQLDSRSCPKLDHYRADCTQKFEELTQMPSKETITVALGVSDAFICRVVKITTASRQQALAVADGIGFYSYGWGGGRFIPTNDLKLVGTAQFKNGETAVIHEFSGVASCWLGSASSSMRAVYHFRPYMRFSVGQNLQFNWDQVEHNYTLRSSVRQFDRTSEVLQ